MGFIAFLEHFRTYFVYIYRSVSPIEREELKMFYKHWKKISLALTGFFWASCDSGTTTEPPLYGAPPQYSSSSETLNSSSSSEDNISSSSEPLPMPAYGVPQMYCEVTSENGSTVTCENGSTCIAKTDTIHISAPECSENMCPLYGVGATIYEKKYECNDGFTYDEIHFKKIYKTLSCTFKGSEIENTVPPKAYRDYECNDGAFCYSEQGTEKTTFNCIDTQGNEITYTEDEFKAKYDLKESE